MANSSVTQLDRECLRDLPYGATVTANIVAQLSGQNQVKGIHPITEQGQVAAVIILCTIGGEHYPNDWLDDDKRKLKYYLEGRKGQDDKKTYNINAKSNQSIADSRAYRYPVYVFARAKKGDLFQFEGEFFYNATVDDANGIDKYFELERR